MAGVEPIEIVFAAKDESNPSQIRVKLQQSPAKARTINTPTAVWQAMNQSESLSQLKMNLIHFESESNPIVTPTITSESKNNQHTNCCMAGDEPIGIVFAAEDESNPSQIRVESE